MKVTIVCEKAFDLNVLQDMVNSRLSKGWKLQTITNVIVKGAFASYESQHVAYFTKEE